MDWVQVIITYEAEGAAKNEQSRETGIIGYTNHKTKTNKNKIKHYTIYVAHHYVQKKLRHETSHK
jgi:hypothetical protein